MEWSWWLGLQRSHPVPQGVHSPVSTSAWYPSAQVLHYDGPYQQSMQFSALHGTQTPQLSTWPSWLQWRVGKAAKPNRTIAIRLSNPMNENWAILLWYYWACARVNRVLSDLFAHLHLVSQIMTSISKVKKNSEMKRRVRSVVWSQLISPVCAELFINWNRSMGISEVVISIPYPILISTAFSSGERIR